MKKLPAFILRAVNRLAARVSRRPPDFCIGGGETEYLHRWYVIPKNPLFNVYLHRFGRSDDDRALHDHPWPSLSIIVSGAYTEHLGHCRRVFTAGALIARSARHAHRIELHDGPCWTLFITGPRIREWGFWCPQGWRHWRVFTDPATGGSTVGRGCE